MLHTVSLDYFIMFYYTYRPPPSTHLEIRAFKTRKAPAHAKRIRRGHHYVVFQPYSSSGVKFLRYKFRKTLHHLKPNLFKLFEMLLPAFNLQLLQGPE